MSNRVLGTDEVNSVLESKEAQAPFQKHWPTQVDLACIAEAVAERNVSVRLSDRKRYSISYRDESVFIRPTNGEFVPCGYISFARLKEVLQEMVEAE